MSSGGLKIADAYVALRVDQDTYRAELQQSQQILEAHLRDQERLLSSVAKASAVGFAALSSAIALTTREYARQEQAEIGLAAALKMIGRYSDDAIADLRRFASEMQGLTIYSDDAILSMMRTGVVLARLSGSALKDAARAAIGLAAALRVDLDTAMMLLSRAMNGQFELFTRYGIVLDKNATAQEKLAAVMRRAHDGFALARAEVETMSGHLSQAKNAFGDLAETIGSVFAPKIESSVRLLSQLTRSIDDVLKRSPGLRTVAGEIGSALTAGLGATAAVAGGAMAIRYAAGAAGASTAMTTAIARGGLRAAGLAGIAAAVGSAVLPRAEQALYERRVAPIETQVSEMERRRRLLELLTSPELRESTKPYTELQRLSTAELERELETVTEGLELWRKFQQEYEEQTARRHEIEVAKIEESERRRAEEIEKANELIRKQQEEQEEEERRRRQEALEAELRENIAAYRQYESQRESIEKSFTEQIIEAERERERARRVRFGIYDIRDIYRLNIEAAFRPRLRTPEPEHLREQKRTALENLAEAFYESMLDKMRRAPDFERRMLDYQAQIVHSLQQAALARAISQ